MKLDHCVIHVSDFDRSIAFCFEWEGPIDGAVEHLAQQGVDAELGPVARRGARGEGQSVYFRDPDGSLLEFISYAS